VGAAQADAQTRASGRTRGKSDPIDALAVARAALREPGLPAAQLPGAALAVRLLVDHRDDLVAERTRMINRLRWHLHALDPELAPPVRTLDRLWVLDRLAGQLAGLEGVRAQIAVELVAAVRQLTGRINQLERDLATQVAPLSGQLRQVVGVGALTAAKLIGHTGGVGRFGRSARFAMHAGVAPIPVWSGNKTRHRLNRGGNRQPPGGGHPTARPSTSLRADGAPDGCREHQTRGPARAQTPPRRRPVRRHVHRRADHQPQARRTTSRRLTRRFA
jgi:transposase